MTQALRDFRNLMTARFLFTLAVQMQAVVLGWQMYLLTEDALFLGLIGLAEAVPALGLALFAGYVVDRGRPLIIYKRVVYLSLISALIVMLTQSSSLGLSEKHQVIALFLASALTGMARAFSQPAIFAIVPRIIKREELAKASAWIATSMQIARISGPALGGLLFGWAGLKVTTFVPCFFLALAGLALSFIKISLKVEGRTQKGESIQAELLSGAVFVFKHPILFPALSLDMVSVLFGSVTALLPIYAAEILMVGPKGLGLLRAAPAIGAALTSFWLTSKDISEKAGAWLFAGVSGFGLCILVFSLSRNFELSLLALGLSGAFDSVSMVVRTLAVQLTSPDSMRGRISAVNSMFIGSSNELGEFESGVLAKFMGVMPAAVFGGIVCLGTVLTVALLAPSLRRLNLKELKLAYET